MIGIAEAMKHADASFGASSCAQTLQHKRQPCLQCSADVRGRLLFGNEIEGLRLRSSFEDASYLI